MAPRVNAEASFLERARQVHGDRYDYSGTRYRSSSEKVTIRCPEHGPFQQFPSNHYRHGCPRCGRLQANAATSNSQDEFLARARAAHGDRYDYSQARYTRNKSKVTIICKAHGAFDQYAANHMEGRGCDRCGGTATSDTASFIERARQVHGDRYDYSQTAYILSSRKVEIGCPDHGPFLCTPNNHISRKVGCPKCGNESIGLQLSGSCEDFIRRAREVHGDNYSYDRAVYTGGQSLLTITCPKHGDFQQRPSDHVNSSNGCPSCTHHYSNFHKEGEEFLSRLGISFTSNVRGLIPRYELDTVITGHPVAVEFNGTFWHSVKEGSHRKNKHKAKYDLCQQAGIHLIQIGEDEWTNEIKQEIWKSILASRLGMHGASVSARKTEFRVLDTDVARRFLRQHHLQGAPMAMARAFGLFAGEDLVGVITFTGHQKRSLSLSRLAFASNVTVVGGASKLFSNALPRLPSGDIVTFSDNRYSNGHIYPILGFVHDADLPPSYRWLYKGSLLNKRQCRHKHLPKLLGDAYDPNQTEHQNMFRAGARCLYDAGYQRWVYARN